MPDLHYPNPAFVRRGRIIKNPLYWLVSLRSSCTIVDSDLTKFVLDSMRHESARDAYLDAGMNRPEQRCLESSAAGRNLTCKAEL